MLPISKYLVCAVKYVLERQKEKQIFTLSWMRTQQQPGNTSLAAGPHFHLGLQGTCPVSHRTRKLLDFYMGDRRPDTLKASCSLCVCTQSPGFQQEYSNKMKIFQNMQNTLNRLQDGTYISFFLKCRFLPLFLGISQFGCKGR